MEYADLNDYELLHYVKENIEEASEVLIKKYYPLVVNVCKRFEKYLQNCGVDKNDLLQEGMLGFIDAINNYLDNQETMFYTYAKTCIEKKVISLIVSSHRKKHKILNESLSYDSPVIISERLLKDEYNDPLNLLIVSDSLSKLEHKVRTKLTTFEEQVFDLMLSGFTYKEIADVLDKEPKQIDNAIQRIRTKTKMIMK